MDHKINHINCKVIAQIEFDPNNIELMNTAAETAMGYLKTEFLYMLAEEVAKKKVNIEILEGSTPFTSKMKGELYVITKEELKEFIKSLKNK